MTKKEDVLSKMSDTDNFEGVQSGREHLELLSKTKALMSYEKSESKKKKGSIDSLLVKLYLAL
jgi:hypothetical protein